MSQQNSEAVIPASQRLQDQFSFTRVPNEIIEHPRLSMQAKMIWIELWKFCYRDGDSAFPGMDKVASDLGVSQETIRKYRKELEKEGLIRVVRRGLTKTNLYYIYTPEPKGGLNQEPKTPLDQETTTGVDEEDKVGIRRSEKKINNISPTEKFATLADKIIDYLNEKAGTRYRHSKASRKYIIARLKEGSTLEDCKLVIDHKVGKWLHDPEMSEYLRPSTLFRPSHFEEYLAAAIRWHEQGRPRSEKEQEARNKALAALGRKFLEEDGDLEPYRSTPPKRESLPPMSPEEKSLIHEIFGGM